MIYSFVCVNKILDKHWSCRWLETHQSSCDVTVTVPVLCSEVIHKTLTQHIGRQFYNQSSIIIYRTQRRTVKQNVKQYMYLISSMNTVEWYIDVPHSTVIVYTLRLMGAGVSDPADHCWPPLSVMHTKTWQLGSSHDDVIKWKHFPRYWTFARGIHRSPVNSPHKGQWHWINVWVSNRKADLSRHCAYYGVIIIIRDEIMYISLKKDYAFSVWSFVDIVIVWARQVKHYYRRNLLALHGSKFTCVNEKKVLRHIIWVENFFP